MTTHDTDHDDVLNEHPGARALRLHAAALPPVPARTSPIQVGDRIRFRVIALWRDRPTAWRVVKSVDPIEVRLGGCGDYIVRPDEVLEVNPS